MSLTLNIFTWLNQMSCKNGVVKMESKNLFIARRLKTLTKDDLPWNKTGVFFAYFPK